MHRNLALSTLWAVLSLSCSISLGPASHTTLTLQLDGGRSVSADFAYWTIEGVSDKGIELPLTTFLTTQGTLKGLTLDTWTFDVKVYDENGAIVQVASSTAAIVAGQANTVVFQLDPVISIGIGTDNSEPGWTVDVDGDIASLPFVFYPYQVVVTAPFDFDTYTWIVNGVVQPETGEVWESGPTPEQEDRLDLSTNSILLIMTLDGKAYSVNIPIVKVVS